jgi:hypothetical protein
MVEITDDERVQLLRRSAGLTSSVRDAKRARNMCLAVGGASFGQFSQAVPLHESSVEMDLRGAGRASQRN